MNEQKNPDEKIDEKFSNMVMSFSQTALVGLGKISNPQTGEVEKNLDMAKTYIDMLQMLSEKTEGNLTKKEKDILGTTVTNLQLTYANEIEDSNKETEKKEEDGQKSDEEN
ncbi:MAG: DUF1844 domain-containing protein [Elusimicrobiota bacterium]